MLHSTQPLETLFSVDARGALNFSLVHLPNLNYIEGIILSLDIQNSSNFLNFVVSKKKFCTTSKPQGKRKKVSSCIRRKSSCTRKQRIKGHLTYILEVQHDFQPHDPNFNMIDGREKSVAGWIELWKTRHALHATSPILASLEVSTSLSGET